MRDDTVFERELHIAARPETVFSFFTDPHKLAQWKGSEAQLDPRPGGIYRVKVANDYARGEFVELIPYSRIVFTWGWEDNQNPLPPGSSTVEVSLSADGNGTLLHLRHSGLPPSAVPSQSEGWKHYLPRLAIVVAGGDPGADPWAASANAA